VKNNGTKAGFRQLNVKAKSEKEKGWSLGIGSSPALETTQLHASAAQQGGGRMEG
jgi:hypothetical protein